MNDYALRLIRARLGPHEFGHSYAIGRRAPGQTMRIVRHLKDKGGGMTSVYPPGFKPSLEDNLVTTACGVVCGYFYDRTIPGVHGNDDPKDTMYRIMAANPFDLVAESIGHPCASQSDRKALLMLGYKLLEPSPVVKADIIAAGVLGVLMANVPAAQKIAIEIATAKTEWSRPCDWFFPRIQEWSRAFDQMEAKICA